jgi:hypothetical protein
LAAKKLAKARERSSAKHKILRFEERSREINVFKWRHAKESSMSASVGQDCCIKHVNGTSPKFSAVLDRNV